jgi:catecholate siderophore receptor
MAEDPVTPAKTVSDPQNREARDERDDIILVEGQKTYQPKQESPKATRPVRDTPQTVTIITRETIEQQNLLTLRDVLQTVPGITFGAAEGGVAPSDQITLRGYSATSDITQDGVRDSAAYSRSDSFNLEQIEIVNGANSVNSGAGSVGGSINIVTKRPQPTTQIVATGGVGTDKYYRATLDANVRASDLIAVRLNAMLHNNDVPGRDVEYQNRWGVAPSIGIGVGGPTSLSLMYLHQEDENIPLYGVPYSVNALSVGPLPGIDRSSYYGFRNMDRQDITVDQATAIFSHEISDTVSVRNLTRWQHVSQLTVQNPPQGTLCLETGRQPNGAACPATVPVGYYLPSGPRGTYRDTDNELMYNQTDLRSVFNTGAIEHTLTVGASYSWEKFSLFNGNTQRTAAGTAPAYPLINIANPNEIVPGPVGFTYGSNTYTGPVNLIASRGQSGEVENIAFYAFDAMKIGKFEVNGGVRYEFNDGFSRTSPVATRISTDAELFSYRIGLLYKPVEAVSIYAAYGNSQTPSQAAVNGSCTIAGVNGATVTSCVTDPEGAKNYEIGVKAELFDGGLLASVAAFRNERDKYRVASPDPTIPDQVLDGRSRVDGISASLIGKVTSAWSITANYTYLEPKLLQSVADGLPDPARNSELINTPNHSGSLFTTYTLPFGLSAGYGVTYQGDFALNAPTATSAVVNRSGDYWVHNAYLAFKANDRWSAQLNVKNFTDATYFTGIRNSGTSGWAVPGAARAAVLTITASY